MSINTVFLPANQVLTVTAVSASSLYEMVGAVPQSPTLISAGSSAEVGPFGSPKNYAVDSEIPATYVFAVSDLAAQDSPTLTTPVLGVATATSINGVSFSSGAGAPDDAVQASLDRNPAGDDNALTFTAVAYGTGSNSISIAYIDPGDNDQTLSVVVVGLDITVNLATGVAGAITSTAADILAAYELVAAAIALATVAIDTGDTGSADDGSGIVTALSAADFTSGAGTGIGTSPKGEMYVDATNAKFYVQGGTLAVPVWNIVTSA